MTEEKQIVLHVRPLDYDELGSYAVRRRILKGSQAIGEAIEADDGMAAIDAAIALEDVVRDRCYTDNGTDIGEVLDIITANEFDALLKILSEGSPVDPTNADSSPSGENEPDNDSPSG